MRNNFDWLVVWNMTFIFPYIGNVIIPTDFHIFSEGWVYHQPVESLTTKHLQQLQAQIPGSVTIRPLIPEISDCQIKGKSTFF